MAKRHKHKKPKARTNRPPVAPKTDEAAPHKPELTHASSSQAAPEVAAAPKPKAAVTATFARAADHGPRGIDPKLAELEYTAVRRDLRKLGVTIVFFVAVIAGLSILDNQTTTIDELGHWLFTWWK